MSKKRPSSFRQHQTATVGRKSRDTPTCPTGPDLVNDYVTQWTPAQFRDEPWYENPNYGSEFDLSMIAGHWTLAQTVNALWRRPVRPYDAARCFRVDDLRQHDYRCIATPSPNNPKHASVLAPLIDKPLAAHIAWWRSPDRVRLFMIAEEVPDDDTQKHCVCDSCATLAVD